MSIIKYANYYVSRIKGDKKKAKPVAKTYKAPQCHYGNVHVFNIGNVRVHGGGTNRGVNEYDADIMMPTLNGYNNDIDDALRQMFPRYTALQEDIVVLPIITQDYKAPTLKKEEWQAIVDDLMDIEEEKDLIVFCIGGHGRTGTVLSVLYGLVHPDKGDPVKVIREKYCKKAVESNSQLDYIEKITGIKVEETASKTYTYKQGKFDGKNWYNGGSNSEPPKKMWIGNAEPVPKNATWHESASYKGWLYTTFGGKTVYRRVTGNGKEKPKDIEMLENTEWRNVGDSLSWAESTMFPGYQYTHIDKRPFYRKVQ